MNLLTLLDMVAEGLGDRVALGTARRGLTGAQLRDQAFAGADYVLSRTLRTVVFTGENGPAFPLALFAAAAAGVPLLPLNYRLAPDQLIEVLRRQDDALLIGDDEALAALDNVVESLTPDEWLRRCAERPVPAEAPVQPGIDDIALLLMTSGTTAAPKTAVLRHRHVTAYVLNTVEFAGSDPDEAVVASVPSYHIAAVANLLSNLYTGRRIVYLDKFSAGSWLRLVTTERVTHAMVVPTMLARIVAELERGQVAKPVALRSLSYGGAKVAPAVLSRALELLPEVGFVNAYGLTETASSIAVLGPEEHRAAVRSDDPTVQARLGSVGKALPSVTIEIRDADGHPSAPNEVGLIYVKGPQVAGEYRESGTRTDSDGWFPTRDEGYLDADGYLFVRGRADDTIIRGGENIAPAEIEAVLQQHESVHDVAVVGLPDDEWGQRIGAFVVACGGVTVTAEQLRIFVRERLRLSKTPDAVFFVDELPHSPTGKILRRELIGHAQNSGR